MLKNFVNAIKAYGEVLPLLTKLNLWGFVLLPALFSLVIGGIIAFTAWHFSDDLGNMLLSWYPWETGKSIAETVSMALSGFMIVILGLLLYKHLVIVLSAPFMSPISEKVESYLTGVPRVTRFSAKQIVRDLLRGIRIALRNILREILLTILLLLLGLIPIFSPVVPILIFGVQAFYAGFGNMDYVLERHFNVKNSIRFVRQHRSIALGNGVVFMGLLALGVGFLIAPPLATVAATIETVKKLDIQPPLSEGYA